LVKDRRRPTLLSGYGAYGISQTPSFDLSRNPWFAAGGVYAVAHVRGGGELGDEWRRAGKGAKKQNGIDDFIACAEHLVAQSYTSPKKLAAKGMSAGGVLVGRAMTQRPELFRAVILEVGALDALRFENTRNGPPNVPEWGSVETQPGFEALRAMSPYEHVSPGTAYPSVLLTAGFNDPRVDVWQPAKMAARLRAASDSGRPILLSVNYDEGHFHTTLSSFNEHHADTWAFLLWQLDELR
jgi:prolyl oligopeptidase